MRLNSFLFLALISRRRINQSNNAHVPVCLGEHARGLAYIPICVRARARARASGRERKGGGEMEKLSVVVSVQIRYVRSRQPYLMHASIARTKNIRIQ